MGAARRLVKHLPRRVGCLRLAGNLRNNCAFEDIHEHEARVAMWLSYLSGSFVDLAHGYLPIVKRKVGQIVLKKRAAAGLFRLCSGVRSGCGEEQEQWRASECVSTSHHGGYYSPVVPPLFVLFPPPHPRRSK